MALSPNSKCIKVLREFGSKLKKPEPLLLKPCLLYTSDAADERSSVDLGGRRIIKKKKKIEHDGAVTNKQMRKAKIEFAEKVERELYMQKIGKEV